MLRLKVCATKAWPHVLFFQLLQTLLKNHLLIKDFPHLTFKTFLVLMIEHRTLCMCVFVFGCACVCRCTFVGVYAVAQTCDRQILTSRVVPQVPSPLFLKQGLFLAWNSPITLSWLSMVCQGFWHKPLCWVCLMWVLGGSSSSPHTCKTSTLLTELAPQLGIYYFPLIFSPVTMRGAGLIPFSFTDRSQGSGTVLAPIRFSSSVFRVKHRDGNRLREVHLLV